MYWDYFIDVLSAEAVTRYLGWCRIFTWQRRCVHDV